eukprot:1338987-Amorphochlora_amoeboformis.AAC.4
MHKLSIVEAPVGLRLGLGLGLAVLVVEVKTKWLVGATDDFGRDTFVIKVFEFVLKSYECLVSPYLDIKP